MIRQKLPKHLTPTSGEITMQDSNKNTQTSTAGPSRSKSPWRRRLLKLGWLAGLLLPFLWTLRLYFGGAEAVDSSKESTYFEVELEADGTLNLSKLVRENCNCLIPAADNAADGLPDQGSFLSPQAVIKRRLKKSLQPMGDYLHEETGTPIPAVDVMRVNWRVASSSLWRTDKEPLLAVILNDWQPLMDDWKQAIERPQVSKPVGVTIHNLRRSIREGSTAFLLRARNHGAHGRWQEAIDDLRVVDRSAEHLADLQCGWFIGDAANIRYQASQCLAFIALSQQAIDPRVKEFALERQAWDYRDVCANAADRGMRMLWMNSATDIHREPTRLGYLLQGALPKQPQAAQLQIKRIHNEVDWTAVMTIINDTVSEAVDACRKESHKEFLLAWNAGAVKHKAKKTAAQVVKAHNVVTPPDLSKEIAWFVLARRRGITQPVVARTKIEDGRSLVQTAFAVRLYRKLNQADPKEASELGELREEALPTDAGGKQLGIQLTRDSLIIKSGVQSFHTEALGAGS